MLVKLMFLLTTHVTSSDDVAAQRIGKRGNGVQRRAISGRERQVFVVTEARRIVLGRAQRGKHVGVDALGGGRQAPPLRPYRLPVAERASRSLRVREAALGVDGGV